MQVFVSKLLHLKSASRFSPLLANDFAIIDQCLSIVLFLFHVIVEYSLTNNNELSRLNV